METSNTTEEQKEVKKKDPLKVVARKPFVLGNVDKGKSKQKDLAVFTSAKQLSEYIYKVTQNTPVQYRWSLVNRMLDTCSSIIEALYFANFERGEKRLALQKTASVKLRLLNHFAETAYAMKIFPFKRLRIITEKVIYSRKLLAGWARITMDKDKREAELLPRELVVEEQKKRVRRTPKVQQLQLNI